MSTWGPQPGRGPRGPEPTSRRAPRLDPGPGDCLGPRYPRNPSTGHFCAVPRLGLQTEDDQHEAEAWRRAAGGQAGPSARSTTAGPSRGSGPRGHGPASAGHHGPDREGSALLPRGIAAELITHAGANHAGRKLRTWDASHPGQVCFSPSQSWTKRPAGGPRPAALDSDSRVLAQGAPEAGFLASS